jgi:hypothetical protein
MSLSFCCFIRICYFFVPHPVGSHHPDLEKEWLKSRDLSKITYSSVFSSIMWRVSASLSR